MPRCPNQKDSACEIKQKQQAACIFRSAYTQEGGEDCENPPTDFSELLHLSLSVFVRRSLALTLTTRCDISAHIGPCAHAHAIMRVRADSLSGLLGHFLVAWRSIGRRWITQLDQWLSWWTFQIPHIRCDSLSPQWHYGVSWRLPALQPITF